MEAVSADEVKSGGIWDDVSIGWFHFTAWRAR